MIGHFVPIADHRADDKLISHFPNNNHDELHPPVMRADDIDLGYDFGLRR